MTGPRIGAATAALPAGLLLAGLLLAGLLLASCGGAAQPSGTPSPAAPPTAASGGGSSQAAALCARYTNASGTLQRVLAEMRTGPVLGPGATFLLIVPRDIAGTPGITDPELAAAMAELTAAIDDLGTQADAKLPAGADPMRTPVPVDPSRAAAAVAKADAACAAHR